MSRRKLTPLLLLTSLVFVALFSIALKKTNNDPPPSVLSTTTPSKASLNPFIELTIPYLKNRTYQSILTSPRLHQTHKDYDSYLTSYDSDGLAINALLTIPKGPKPPQGWPAVVFIHGYIPPKNYKTTEKYTSYVDYLAKNGLVVLKIDLRGHGSSQGEPSGAYYSGDYVIDTLNAHAALQKTDYTDKTKIGLWGHSMGGNVAFRSFIVSPDIKKIAIWAGAVYSYSDFAQYRISDSSYQAPSADLRSAVKRRQLFEAHGTFDPKSEFWKQVPGTNYLEGKTGQIQLHHAIDDPVVSIGYSRNLKDLLKDSSIKLSLFEYPNGGHNLTGASFDKAMQRTASFLKEY